MHTSLANIHYFALATGLEIFSISASTSSFLCVLSAMMVIVYTTSACLLYDTASLLMILYVQVGGCLQLCLGGDFWAALTNTWAGWHQLCKEMLPTASEAKSLTIVWSIVPCKASEDSFKASINGQYITLYSSFVRGVTEGYCSMIQRSDTDLPFPYQWK